MTDRLLDVRETEAKTKRSKSKIYSSIRAGLFPPPVIDGGRARWRESELDRWIAELPSKKVAA
jgi:predicted DNA-binding transcriptional regulator AlpA